MYHIIKNGAEIGAAERLSKAIKQRNGCIVIKSDGNLLAFGGEIYNVDSEAQTEGFEPVIVVWKDDVANLQAQSTNAVTQTQLALAELAETESAHDLENKLALAELAEMIGGTSNG